MNGIQCAAVRTHSGAIKAPPQPGNIIWTIHGYSPFGASAPPTMRSAAGRTCSLGAAWWAVDKTRRPFSSLAASAVTSTAAAEPRARARKSLCIFSFELMRVLLTCGQGSP